MPRRKPAADSGRNRGREPLEARILRLQAENARLAHLASFLERNPNPVVEIDRDGRVQYTNPAARHLFPDLVEQGSEHPWLHGSAAYTRSLRAGPSSTTHRIVKIGHRSYQQVLLRVRGRAAICVYGFDVTEHWRAEEALRESRRDMDRAQEVGEFGWWRLDTRADQLAWSDGACRIFGVPAATPQTYESFLKFVHPDDCARVDAQWRAAVGGGTYEIEHRIVVGEQVKWVREKAYLEFDDVGVWLGGFGIVQDISSRKQAEHALREANLQLEHADRQKDEFIAALSHELRNPLAPICYALPLLRREGLGTTATRAVDIIERQLDHITRLIDDLLEVSRIRYGRIRLDRQRLKLDSVITCALDAVLPVIERRQHQLDVVVSDDPVWVDGDAQRLTQALTNLLGNAAKFTPDGGRITLTAGREGDQVVIRVSDTGAGIAPEALPHVFEMFRQAADVDGSQVGLGLGLALADRFVELHGGSITASSAGIGQGAEFVIRLPLAATQPALPPEAGEAPVASATRRLRVLVVDDNADLVELLADVIRDAGHDVCTAADGAAALESATRFRPDLVFLDLGLPTMGGLEVARELRKRPETAAVRLIALTGWGREQDRRETAAAMFDDHVTKPADLRVLRKVLADVAASLGQTDSQGRSRCS